MAVAAPSAREGIDDARREARRKSLLHPLQRIARDFRERMRAGLHARGHALQPAHASVIVNLSSSGNRLTEIAERAGMTKQAMGKLVDELEVMGYVDRVPDPPDGRAKRIRFSRKGLVLLRDSGEVVDEIWGEYAQLVGEPGLLRLRNTLDRLLRGLDARRSASSSSERGA